MDVTDENYCNDASVTQFMYTCVSYAIDAAIYKWKSSQVSTHIQRMFSCGTRRVSQASIDIIWFWSGFIYIGPNVGSWAH
ncbi:unnamed protein product [Allacma fusca]|uniref:Uncharacterized protein n=1 Tax=Allacma fusca TaxID=39272 RepID=A0A8J2JGM6_9HEXA|nr:unnamed protein product [Allacma fusca]